ncbi:MAG: tRNA 2-thiouridine(34) synthase MnmA [Candidatus Omnitrophica bacterium]|nr:tRNA 2-thiouridine(34) synthase MnmA [Candidatus Omnitrophota bacterium]
MKKRVIVAMSGGVDSSVAAYLLREQGYDVIGITLKLWDSDCEKQDGCCGFSGIIDAKKVSNKIGIRHYVLNAKKIFREKIITYFIDGYLKGQTPNPCAYCNNFIKFDYLLEKAKEISSKFVATGHYANIFFDPHKQRYVLKKGIDEQKDQSYFLSLLNQKQLSSIIFPLANLTKRQVRDIAKKVSLPVAEKPQSQEICFIPDNDYVNFIKNFKGLQSIPGPIKDLKGKNIGTHSGLISYTIGQRKGLGISSEHPLYVKKIVPRKNTIYVADKERIYQKTFYVNSLNPVFWKDFPERFRCNVKIRHKNPESPCYGKLVEDNKIKVTMKQPQWAPTPGQLAVFYRKDTVLGAGIIEKT